MKYLVIVLAMFLLVGCEVSYRSVPKDTEVEDWPYRSGIVDVRTENGVECVVNFAEAISCNWDKYNGERSMDIIKQQLEMLTK